MRIDIEEAARELLNHDNILLLAHASPDGDTLGSCYALCRTLHLLGKKARVLCCDRVPACYSFVPDGIEVQEFPEDYVVAVDVAAISLLGDDDFVAQWQDKIALCIDHHGTNTDYAPLVCVEPESAACAETILRIIRLMDVEIDKDIAECIYVGLATDTGCFRYSNTTSRTMRMAADMMDYNIDIATINRIMFETRTKSYNSLETLALSGMKITEDGKIAVITVTKDMFEQSGAQEDEFHPIKALPRQIEGVYAGISLREKKEGEFRVSVRTNYGVNASEICAIFGGGGHPGAAGCTVFGTAEECRKKVVEAAYNIINR